MSEHHPHNATQGSGSKPKMIIVYALIIVLILWLALLTVRGAEETGEWVCAQQVCSASEPGGELWAQQNCGFVNDTENGGQVEVCQVSVNGQTQLVRKSELNLTSIRNCVEFACVQEVRVRDVNYTLSNETA